MHSLKKYNTFGFNVSAERFLEFKSASDLDIIKNGGLKESRYLILGSGSNILFRNNYEGTVIHPACERIEITSSDKHRVIVRADAGVIWDRLVEWAVKRNLGGIENLSYIPGTVGAAPVQNIGAYGVELKDYIESVETIDLDSGDIRIISNEECQFDYRSSIFKAAKVNKYLIYRISIRLDKEPDEFNTSYGNLEEEVLRHGEINLENIRKAVIRVRKSKLPEPDEIGNAGSFFKNPLIPRDKFEDLKSLHPDLPSFESGNLLKIPAAWMIEKCGWKGYRSGDSGVYENHALILVNYGKASGSDIYNLSEQIIKSVNGEFGIRLEREVRVI